MNAWFQILFLLLPISITTKNVQHFHHLINEDQPITPTSLKDIQIQFMSQFLPDMVFTRGNITEENAYSEMLKDLNTQINQLKRKVNKRRLWKARQVIEKDSELYSEMRDMQGYSAVAFCLDLNKVKSWDCGY